MLRKRQIKLGQRILCAAFAASMALLISCGKEFKVKLGNQEIGEEEFTDSMNAKMYEVSQYFSEKYGAASSKDFWEQEFGGEYPYQKLSEETMSRLREIHAVYRLAEEKGYVESVSYDELKRRWNQENKARKEKTEKGEAVYGLKEFTLDLFLEYEMDSIQKKYCEDTANEGMKISEEEGLAYYEENKDRMFVAYDEVELNYIRVYYQAERASVEQAAEYKSALNRVKEKLRQGGQMEAAVQDEPLLSGYFTNKTVTSEEYGSQSRDIWDVLELSRKLAQGESTSVLDENGCLYLIECAKRIDHDYQPYEEVKQIIGKKIKEEHYNEIIQKRAEQLVFEGEMEEVYTFTKEKVKETGR